MTKPVLLDTGPLVAILHKRDAEHVKCVATAKGLRGRLVTCWPVVTEAAWMLRTHPREIQRLMDGIDRGPFLLADLPKEAAKRIGAFLSRYETLGAQLADAAIMYLSARDAIETVFTLDRRDFGIYRTTKGAALHIIPEI